MKTALDLVKEAKASVKEVSVDEAEALISQADVLIDVREGEEFKAGHIPAAINIPRGLLEFKLSSDASLESRDLKVILYCKTSGRAALSAKAMSDMGYLNIQSIAGGFDAWEAGGKSVVKSTLPDFE